MEEVDIKTEIEEAAEEAVEAAECDQHIQPNQNDKSPSSDDKDKLDKPLTNVEEPRVIVNEDESKNVEESDGIKTSPSKSDDDDKVKPPSDDKNLETNKNNDDKADGEKDAIDEKTSSPKQPLHDQVTDNKSTESDDKISEGVKPVDNSQPNDKSSEQTNNNEDKPCEESKKDDKACDDNKPNESDRYRYTPDQLLELRTSNLSNEQPNERDKLFLMLRGLRKKNQDTKQPTKCRPNSTGYSSRNNRPKGDEAIIWARKSPNFPNLMIPNSYPNQFQHPSNDNHDSNNNYNNRSPTKRTYSGGDQFHWINKNQRPPDFQYFPRTNFERPQSANSNHHMQYSGTPTEHPEWFSDGPTSKYDVIDLHGFQDGHDQEEKINDDVQQKPKISSTPTKTDSGMNDTDIGSVNGDDHTCNKTISSSSGNGTKNSSHYGDRPFNFDDFWSMDPPHHNGSGHDNSWNKRNRSSQFSKWFNKNTDHSYRRNDSLDSSLHNELNRLINESGDSSNLDKSHENGDISNQLLEMMHKLGKRPPPAKRRYTKSKYIPLVSELEAKLLNESMHANEPQQVQQQNQQSKTNSQKFKAMLNNSVNRSSPSHGVDGLQFLKNFTQQSQEYWKSLNMHMRQKLFQQMMGSATITHQQRQNFYNFLNSIALQQHQQQRNNQFPPQNYRQYNPHNQYNNNGGYMMQQPYQRMGNNSGRPILKGTNYENVPYHGNFEQKNLHVHFQGDYQNRMAQQFGQNSNQNMFGSQEIFN